MNVSNYLCTGIYKLELEINIANIQFPTAYTVGAELQNLTSAYITDLH